MFNEPAAAPSEAAAYLGEEPLAGQEEEEEEKEEEKEDRVSRKGSKDRRRRRRRRKKGKGCEQADQGLT